MKKIFILLIAGIFFKLNSTVTNDSAAASLKLSGYIESYYSYFFNKPNNNKSDYLYSFNRHNEFNINLGFIKAAYENKNIRANMAIMIGSYANENLASEPSTAKNIFEANTGIKLSKKKNLWLDAGIFSSHIGFETAVGKDCQTLTRSLLAENSPYYESGLKLTFISKNDKLLLSGLLLNGWQKIYRITRNQTPAFGHQLTYKFSDNFLINSSSFVGNVYPDSARRMRYFHNFFSQIKVNKKMKFTVGFDAGAEQISKKSTQYNLWFSPILIGQYVFNDAVSLTLRAEQYNDAKQVIVATNTVNGFVTSSVSANLDFNIYHNALWRIEARYFKSKDQIFVQNGLPTNEDYLLTTSLALSF